MGDNESAPRLANRGDAQPDSHAGTHTESDSHSRPPRLTWDGHPQLTPEYQRRRDAVTGRRIPKPPPHAPQTELALVGAVCTFPDRVLAEVLATGIEPAHFYTPATRRAWEAVLEQHQTGEPVDVHTVDARLGERSTIADAVVALGGAMPTHASAWARVIIDHAHARAMLPPLRAALHAAQDGRTDAVYELLNAVLDAGEVAAHECR